MLRWFSVVLIVMLLTAACATVTLKLAEPASGIVFVSDRERLRQINGGWHGLILQGEQQLTSCTK